MANSSSSSSVDLENVPSVSLMTELLRRMKCSTKPDKRLILIGPPASGKGTQNRGGYAAAARLGVVRAKKGDTKSGEKKRRWRT